MQYITFGRTGLKVSDVGLGCGGHSRIGLEKYGLAHASGIVRAAFDAGINYFDTATAYGTQEAVGLGLRGIARDRYVISTKFPYSDWNGNIRTAKDFWSDLESSLKLLGTDYIDAYFFHGVTPEHYERVMEELYPELLKAREQGKVRYLAISELFNGDSRHEMLKRAVAENYFDVIMVGCNMLNFTASTKGLLSAAGEKQIATLCMFAVRSALSDPEELKASIEEIYKAGQGNKALIEECGGFDFLVNDGYASGIVEAAYRFVRHTPGLDVILTGTGNEAHLKENIGYLSMPPLADEALRKIRAMFGGVDCVTGEAVRGRPKL